MKRALFEIGLLLSIGALLFFSPAAWFMADAKLGMLNLFIVKLAFVSAGALHAHAGRKVMFPYLDLKKLVDQENTAGVFFLMVWYGLIIFAWARGG